MNLYTILKLLDRDTVISVELNCKTVYRGFVDRFADSERYERFGIKALYIKMDTLFIQI